MTAVKGDNHIDVAFAALIVFICVGFTILIVVLVLSR